MFKVTTLAKAIETAKALQSVGFYDDAFLDFPQALQENYEFMYNAIVDFCEDGYQHGKDYAKEINKVTSFIY